jgi:hypothetical protein
MSIKPSKKRKIFQAMPKEQFNQKNLPKAPENPEMEVFNNAKKELVRLNYESQQGGFDDIERPNMYKNLYKKTLRLLVKNKTLRDEFTELVANTGVFSNIKLLVLEKETLERFSVLEYQVDTRLWTDALIKDLKKKKTVSFIYVDETLNKQECEEVYTEVIKVIIHEKDCKSIVDLINFVDSINIEILYSELSKLSTYEVQELSNLFLQNGLERQSLHYILINLHKINDNIDLYDPFFAETWSCICLEYLTKKRFTFVNKIPIEYLGLNGVLDLINNNSDNIIKNSQKIGENYCNLENYLIENTSKEEFNTSEKLRKALGILNLSDMVSKNLEIASFEKHLELLSYYDLNDVQENELKLQTYIYGIENNLLGNLADRDLVKSIFKSGNHLEQIMGGYLISLFEGSDLHGIIQQFIDEDVIYKTISKLPNKQKYLPQVTINNIETLFSLCFFEPDPRQAITHFLESNYEVAKKIKELTGTVDKIMDYNDEMFGDDGNYETYGVIERVMSGGLLPEDLEAGLTKTGEEGMQEFKRLMKQFKEKVNNTDLAEMAQSGELSKMLSHDLFANYLINILRVNKSQYKTTADELRVIAGDYEQRVQNGTQVQLPSNYVNKRVNVKRLDQEAMDKQQVSTDVARQYEEEVREILSIKNELEGSGIWAVRTLIREMKQELVMLETDMSSGLSDHNAHPKKLESLTKQIEKLGNLKKFSFGEYEEVLGKLIEFKPLEKYAKKLLYFMALHSNPDAVGTISQLNTTPDKQDIDTMVEFINHTLKAETWESELQDTKLKKKLFALTRIQSFEAESARLRNVGEAGVFEYEFEPTKGLLMELSGSFSDACWAGIENVSEKHPNISTLVFRKNPGNKHERIVGSCMLIETVAVDGTPLTVIRGINPLENESFQMVSQDFVDQIIGYVNEINQSNDKQTAIVIDDHQGGSASNRTAIYAELKSRMPQLKQIEVGKADTTFNDYDISQDVYLV